MNFATPIHLRGYRSQDAVDKSARTLSAIHLREIDSLIDRGSRRRFIIKAQLEDCKPQDGPVHRRQLRQRPLRRGGDDSGIQLLATLPRPAREAPGEPRVRFGQRLVDRGILQTIGQDELQGMVGLIQLEEHLHGGFSRSPPTGRK
jgi:hypothetical protein